MRPPNALYAQSGGVTAVTNASACGVIRGRPAPSGSDRHGHRCATASLACSPRPWSIPATIVPINSSGCTFLPGGIFGSCRFDLDDEQDNRHGISGYSTCWPRTGSVSVSTTVATDRCTRPGNWPSRRSDVPIPDGGRVPKTVDNDILETDCCLGPRLDDQIPRDLDGKRRCDLASMRSRQAAGARAPR